MSMIIVYKRFLNSEYISAQSGKEGRRGYISIERSQRPVFACHAIERGNGFARIKKGFYQGEICFMTTKTGNRLKAIRVHDVPIYRKNPDGIIVKYLINSILFHPANDPVELQGCVAPGLEISPNGVSESQMGLDKIFHYLGGFKVGEPVKIFCEELRE